MNFKKSEQKRECDVVSLSKSEDDSTNDRDENTIVEKRGIFFG